MQWLTRSPDTREIPSSSLGIVIFPFGGAHWAWIIVLEWKCLSLCVICVLYVAFSAFLFVSLLMYCSVSFVRIHGSL